MIHPIKTNRSSHPPPKGPRQARMINTKNTSLRLNELCLSCNRGQNSPSGLLLFRYFLETEGKYSSHAHHSAPALKTIPRSSYVL